MCLKIIQLGLSQYQELFANDKMVPRNYLRSSLEMQNKQYIISKRIYLV